MPVGHENVEQPVVIVVEKARSPTQKRDRQCPDSSAKTDVGERRVAFIPIKRVVIVGKIRDVEINFTIAVVIAHCYSHGGRSEEHTSELQSLTNLVCRLLL